MLELPFRLAVVLLQKSTAETIKQDISHVIDLFGEAQRGLGPKVFAHPVDLLVISRLFPSANFARHADWILNAWELVARKPVLPGRTPYISYIISPADEHWPEIESRLNELARGEGIAAGNEKIIKRASKILADINSTPPPFPQQVELDEQDSQPSDETKNTTVPSASPVADENPEEAVHPPLATAQNLLEAVKNSLAKSNSLSKARADAFRADLVKIRETFNGATHDEIGQIFDILLKLLKYKKVWPIGDKLYETAHAVGVRLRKLKLLPEPQAAEFHRLTGEITLGMYIGGETGDEGNPARNKIKEIRERIMAARTKKARAAARSAG